MIVLMSRRRLRSRNDFANLLNGRTRAPGVFYVEKDVLRVKQKIVRKYLGVGLKFRILVCSPCIAARSRHLRPQFAISARSSVYVLSHLDHVHCQRLRHGRHDLCERNVTKEILAKLVRC